MKVELPVLPQAFFDEFNESADDRVQDYARLAVTQAVAAERARWEAEVAGLRTLLERIRDDQSWRSKDNSLWPDICAALTKKD